MLSKIHGLHAARRAAKRDRGGGREVHYGAFKMVGLSFTDTSQQQLILFSLSTEGDKTKEAVWGQ